MLRVTALRPIAIVVLLMLVSASVGVGVSAAFLQAFV